VVCVLTTICLFIPYLTINGITTNIVDLLKNWTFDWNFFLNLVPFVLIYISAILLVLSHFVKKIHVVNLPLSLIAGLIFSFVVNINSSVYEDVLITIGVAPILLAIASFYISLLSMRDAFESLKMTIKDIVEIAIFVSFALVLQLPFLKIKLVATGGSISFTMIPLILLCLRKGFFKGFIAVGLVFGLADCMIDGYGFVTYPLDYLLAYGSLSLVAIFNKFINVEKPNVFNYLILTGAIVLGLFGRLVFSTISGMVLYNTNFIESVLYQLSYIGPSGGIAIAGVLLLYKPLTLINKKI
jgi:thiamine transporter